MKIRSAVLSIVGTLLFTQACSVSPVSTTPSIQAPTSVAAPVIAPVSAPQSAPISVPTNSSTPPSVPQTVPQNRPMSLYRITGGELSSLRFWGRNHPDSSGQPAFDTDYVEHLLPAAASPEHGTQPFATPGRTRQYISLDDGFQVTGIDFQLPVGATFMKPNVDTMLTCLGLMKLIHRDHVNVRNAIDVGAGSGFISKYVAQSVPQSRVVAVDIDPQAGVYMRSEGANMPSNVVPVIEDAITHLNTHHEYDLVVSNPPYVPTEAETQSVGPIAVDHPSFWAGTGIMSHMLEHTLPNMPIDGHLVMVVPSTSLKSMRLVQVLNGLTTRGFQARVLHEQEVAYKAWFAGNNRVTHLLATEAEVNTPLHIGPNLDLFVGITAPGHPRNCRVEDGRRGHLGYHWQIVYVVDFSRI